MARYNKHYYAEYSPYGIDSICPWGDELLRFDSKRDRDDFVTKLNIGTDYAHEMKAQALTTREINRSKYAWRSKHAIWDPGEVYAHLITGYYQTLSVRSDYVA